MGACHIKIAIFFVLIYFFLFLFNIGVQLINNVVLVSGVQQSDSVIHIHVSVLFQILWAELLPTEELFAGFREMRGISLLTTCGGSRGYCMSLLSQRKDIVAIHSQRVCGD